MYLAYGVNVNLWVPGGDYGWRNNGLPRSPCPNFQNLYVTLHGQKKKKKPFSDVISQRS